MTTGTTPEENSEKVKNGEQSTRATRKVSQRFPVQIPIQFRVTMTPFLSATLFSF